MAQLSLWTEIGTKQWFVLGASAFQYMRAGFLCPECDNFAKIKMSFIWKDDFFFAKIGIFCKLVAGIGWSVGFNSWTNWTLYGVMPRSLCKIRLNDVFEMFNCWEQRWINVDGASHTLYSRVQHSSNILGCTHCFWLFTLWWFIDEDASFFHFFHKLMNIRSWQCFSSSKIRMQFSHTFCNITMIFKVISQFFSALLKLCGT